MKIANFNPILRYRAARRIDGKEAGIGLLEILLALAIGAVLIIGGITAFNAAITRTAISNTWSGVQVFMLDFKAAKRQFRNEPLAAGQSVTANHPDSAIREWGAGGAAAVAPTSDPLALTTCRAASAAQAAWASTGTDSAQAYGNYLCRKVHGPGIQAPVSTTAYTVSARPMDSLNTIIRMPSVAYGPGGHEDDSNAEYYIRQGRTGALEMAFALYPAAGDATSTLDAQATADTGEIWEECPNPTRAVFEIAMPNDDVCLGVLDRAEQLDTFRGLACYGPSLGTQGNSGETFTNLPSGHESILVLCD